MAGGGPPPVKQRSAAAKPYFPPNRPPCQAFTSPTPCNRNIQPHPTHCRKESFIGMDEHRPLLPSDRLRDRQHGTTDRVVGTARHRTKQFLTSKTGHYSVLLLVSLDVTAIFTDLILQLLTCEGRVPRKDGGEAQNVLGIVSLVFSCLFMVELLASIWVFGWRYFASWFHCLDATVITAAFVIDVVLKGVLEEVGSLVVILRLWRVFKIIEELSAGAEEQMEPLHERLHELEAQNGELKHEIDMLKTQQTSVVA